MRQLFSSITGSSRALVVVGFVLLFGGIGTYALLFSHAATGCTQIATSVTDAQNKVNAAANGDVVCMAPGDYTASGAVTFNTSHTAYVTFESEPSLNPNIQSCSVSNNATGCNNGGQVTIKGINIAANFIAVKNLYSTGAINIGSSSPYPGFHDITIDHNAVGPTNGYGISILSSASTPSYNVTVSNNIIHNTSTSGEGDALRFDGWHDVTVSGNEMYNLRECAGNGCHTDTLQSYNGTATTNLTVTKNYTHDNVGAQGLPFLKDGDISNVNISDNLSLRNTNTNGQVTGVWVDDNTTSTDLAKFPQGLMITNNTYQVTSGSIVQPDGSAQNPTVGINHNVFDNLNVRPGSGPSYTTTEDFDIFTGNDQYTFKLGPNSLLKSNPGFKCASSCGVGAVPPANTPSYTELTGAANDDYELASNPNGIGIDWNPANQHYGPLDTSGTGGGSTTPPPVNTPPTVSVAALSSPVSGIVNLSASANVTTAGASISSVQFKDGSTNIGSADTASPYTASWNTVGLTNGSHTITAVATDSNGLQATSSSITVTVSNSTTTPPSDTTPPTVSLTSPSSGSTLKGTTTVTATASDNVGVSSVQLQVDGANVGTADTTSPYSFSWDTSSVIDGSHKLTVLAKDAAGNSTTSGSVTVTVNNAPPVPTTPTNLHSTATTQTSISLAWTDTDPSVSGYLVYRGGTLIKTITTATASLTDSGLTAGTDYSYTVKAYDNGNSANPSLPTNPLVVTTAPAQQSISPPTKLAGTAANYSTINLSWTASTSSNASHYYVVRSSANAPAATIAVLGNVTGFMDSPVSASTAYTYYVMAGDGSGNFSGPSSSITITTPKAPDTTAPTVPAGVTALAVSSTQINLSWTASTDNSGQVAGYYIFRSDNGSAIATVSSGTTSWGESSLTPNTTYTYTVKAYDGSGNISAASTAASATTLPQVTNTPTTVGTTGIGSQVDSNNPGTGEIFQTLASTSGTVANIHVYIDRTSKATKVTVGLYQDSGGRAGSLMSQGTTTSLQNGAWNVVPIPQADIAANHTYWIAILGIGNGNVAFRDVNNGSPNSVSSKTNLTSLPSQWSSGTIYKNSPISAYATN